MCLESQVTIETWSTDTMVRNLSQMNVLLFLLSLLAPIAFISLILLSLAIDFFFLRTTNKICYQRHVVMGLAQAL